MSPAYAIRRVPIEKIYANSYNPNIMAPPEMKLLELSIFEDGYTMPVVCYYDEEKDKYEIVDGYHRYLVMLTSSRIAKREENYLPVSVIQKPLTERIVSTIRHNRARGTHSIELTTNIVHKLVESGKNDSWIMEHLGMGKDELLRLKQSNGVSYFFRNKSFSQAWENEIIPIKDKDK